VPFCPVCHSEFREGFERCNSCDADLVDQLEEEMDLTDEAVKQALEGKELVPVTRGWLDVVKESRELLSAKRIASIIVESDEDPIHPGAPKRVQLVVSKDDLEATAEVLGDSFKQMVDEEGVAPVDLTYEKCPACGKDIAEDIEECPECGLFIGKV